MKKTTDLSKWCAPEKEFIVDDVILHKGKFKVGKSISNKIATQNRKCHNDLKYLAEQCV